MRQITAILRGFFCVSSSQIYLNPFTVPALTISGLKSAHIHPCKQYIRWSYKKSTFVTVHFDRNPLKCSCVGEEALKVSDLSGTFIGRFPSDGRGKHGSERVKQIYVHTEY